ncbi:class I SAM-dependent methyltransferase [Candidatus Nomurabacteria bacterium]|nr:class I SAM-dependent methyltransferase [Candidatus Nomurabacteria bacterium]
MKRSTVIRLMQFNKAFYKAVAKDFSDSRNYEWEGWNLAWNSVAGWRNGLQIEAVLDIGCGNGRFVDFLRRKRFQGRYLGLDNSRELLEIAQNVRADFQANFRFFDLYSLIGSKVRLDRIVGEEKYDLILLSGVMHHIPGFANRLQLLNRLSQYLSPEGCIVVSYWQFMKSSRFSKKIVRLEDTPLASLKEDLEEGDHILTWNRGVRGLRYCHDFSDEEIEKINSQTPVRVVEQFGSDGGLNKYVVYSGA